MSFSFCLMLIPKPRTHCQARRRMPWTYEDYEIKQFLDKFKQDMEWEGWWDRTWKAPDRVVKEEKTPDGEAGVHSSYWRKSSLCWFNLLIVWVKAISCRNHRIIWSTSSHHHIASSPQVQEEFCKLDPEICAIFADFEFDRHVWSADCLHLWETHYILTTDICKKWWTHQTHEITCFVLSEFVRLRGWQISTNIRKLDVAMWGISRCNASTNILLISKRKTAGEIATPLQRKWCMRSGNFRDTKHNSLGDFCMSLHLCMFLFLLRHLVCLSKDGSWSRRTISHGRGAGPVAAAASDEWCRTHDAGRF